MALEAQRGQAPLSDLAERYQVNATQDMPERDSFNIRRRERSRHAGGAHRESERLQAKIGQLFVKRDFVARGSALEEAAASIGLKAAEVLA